MVTILGSSWYSAMPVTANVAFLQLPMQSPVIGIVLVRVDPAGDLKAYIGVAPGRDRLADEDFIVDWGGHFSVAAARILVNASGERVKGDGTRS